MTFKNAEMEKSPKEWVKYDWNKTPQPQLVGFRDFVGVSIAPVSKKLLLSTYVSRHNTQES